MAMVRIEVGLDRVVYVSDKADPPHLGRCILPTIEGPTTWEQQRLSTATPTG